MLQSLVQSHKVSQVSEPVSKSRSALLSPMLSLTALLCTSKASESQWLACLQTTHWSSLWVMYQVAIGCFSTSWVPSCSIFYLFNTFHCQSVCNLLPGTGCNKKQWLLLQPLALSEIIFLVRAATTVPHFHSLPYQMITFCPSWNFCSPCSFCMQVVGFTIWCNVPHYTIRIKIRVQPLFSHHFGTTLVTLRYIRITSLVMTLRLFSLQTNSGNQRVSGGRKLDSKYCVYVYLCVYLCAENEKHSKRGMGFKTKIIVLINRLIKSQENICHLTLRDSFKDNWITNSLQSYAVVIKHLGKSEFIH